MIAGVIKVDLEGVAAPLWDVDQLGNRHRVGQRRLSIELEERHLVVAEDLADEIRPSIPRDELGGNASALLAENLVANMPLPRMEASVEGLRPLLCLRSKVPGNGATDVPVPLEEALGPLLEWDQGTGIETNQFPFQVIPHRPATVEVTRAEPAGHQGTGHHDEENQVQGLGPLLRVRPRELKQDHTDLLVHLPVHRLSKPDLLRPMRRRDPVVDPEESANLLKDCRTKLLSSIVANEEGDGQRAKHGSADRLHCLVPEEGLAGHQHGNPEEPASVGEHVAVALLTLRKRALEVDVNVQPGTLVGRFVRYPKRLGHRLASDFAADLAGGHPKFSILRHGGPERHLPESCLGATSISVPPDGRVVHLLKKPPPPSP